MTDALETLTAALAEIEADVRGDPVGRRWDNPRLMLNIVTGARAIVALHQPHYDWPDDPNPTCGLCVTDHSGMRDEWEPDPWPCPTLTALAAMFAAEPEQATEARA